MPEQALAVVAFGGNALILPDQAGTQREQQRAARRAARAITTLVREGYRVLLVHGNGPQVGRELLRNEEASTKIPPHPMDVCVAATQGMTGSLLQVALTSELRSLGHRTRVSTVVTHVLVSRTDPAFERPTKPIGPFYTPWRARALMKAEGVHMVEDAGRGWRRVVPSPRPLEVLDIDGIEALLAAGHVVIGAGGGGVPVAVDHKGRLTGVEAVIDKDRTAALLADHLGAELLVFMTAVDQVYINFGRTDQRPIDAIGAEEMRAHMAAGQFPDGSMGPKVEAAVEFVEDGGATAIITSADKLAAALADRAGTRISRACEANAVRRQIPLFPRNDSNGDDLSDQD